jgi:hypothetical protein
MFTNNVASINQPFLLTICWPEQGPIEQQETDAQIPTPNSMTLRIRINTLITINAADWR